jgi:exosome complex RNA-binding protein Csl4
MTEEDLADLEYLAETASTTADENYGIVTCPECSSEMYVSGHCATCPNCGFSLCSM